MPLRIVISDLPSETKCSQFRFLAMCRSKLSAVITQLMPKMSVKRVEVAERS